MVSLLITKGAAMASDCIGNTESGSDDTRRLSGALFLLGSREFSPTDFISPGHPDSVDLSRSAIRPLGSQTATPSPSSHRLPPCPIRSRSMTTPRLCRTTVHYGAFDGHSFHLDFFLTRILQLFRRPFPCEAARLCIKTGMLICQSRHS